MTAEQQKAIATAERLTASLEEMAEELRVAKQRQEKADRQARILRHVVLALAVSLFLDVILTVFVAVAAVSAHDASRTAESTASSNLALCRASNVARTQQIDLWNFLLDLGKPPKTKAGRTIIATFEHHLHVVFAPRDCANLGR